MKRRIIWAFSIVLWLLVFSTIFSHWVEKAMAPAVTECYPDTSISITEPRLPLDCLFRDDSGTPVLYQVFDGLAWASGTRVKLVDPSGYNILDDYIIYYGQEPVIQYSTKELIPGEKAVVAGKSESREDRYLAICPTGVRLKDDLPENITILAQTEGAVLLRDTAAPTVFMPKRAAEELFVRRQLLPHDETVYSLADVENFLKAMPLAALLPIMIVFVLILWAASFPLLKDLSKNRMRLLRNICLAAGALAVVLAALNFLRLPPSLLPRDSIVDIPHYAGTISEVLSWVKKLSGGTVGL